MMFKLKLNSIGDLITNSSSETFIVNSGKTKEVLYGFIEDLIEVLDKDAITSGVDGDLDLYTLDDLTEAEKTTLATNKRSHYTPYMESLHYYIDFSQWDDTTFLVKIDQNYVNTIEYLIASGICIECWMPGYLEGEKYKIIKSNEEYQERCSKSLPILDGFYIDENNKRHLICI